MLTIGYEKSVCQNRMPGWYLDWYLDWYHRLMRVVPSNEPEGSGHRQ